MSKKLSLTPILVACGVAVACCPSFADMSNLTWPQTDARSAAMGGTDFAITKDAGAAVANPAALADLKNVDVTYAYHDFDDTDITADFGAVAVPMGKAGTVGAAYSKADLTDFVGQGWEENAYTLAYARRFGTFAIGLGINRNVIETDYMDAKGLNTTWGVLYDTGDGTKCALRVRDASSRLKWDDDTVEKFSPGFDLGAYRTFDCGNCKDAMMVVGYTNAFSDPWNKGFRAGVEVSPWEQIAFRAGYAYGRGTAGLGLKSGNVSVDAAWAYEPALGKQTVIAATVRF